LSEGVELKGLCTAHIHKALSIIKQGRQIFIVLPAFLMDEKEISRNITFNPSVLLMNIEEDREEIEIFEKDFNDINVVKAFNDKLVSCVRRDYKKCLDLVTTSVKKEDVLCVEYGQRRRCFNVKTAEKVVELYKQGISKEAIGKTLGIDKNIVYAILKYSGIEG